MGARGWFSYPYLMDWSFAMKESLQDVIDSVQSYDRDHCIAQLLRIRRPKVDFTAEFLQQQSLDRLRHILVAAFLQARKSCQH